ncbi:MAG: hypothetical protein JST16_09055 [Bdellovibrionales bacterium]|nr:hypothetical protein [Bdellovibrionales bacterium]
MADDINLTDGASLNELPPSAGNQARDLGAQLQQAGVTQSTAQTYGPQQQELNTQGGWQVDTQPNAGKPPDNRPPLEQAQAAGQTLNKAGVIYSDDPADKDKTSRVETALANARSAGQNAPSVDQNIER